MSQVFTTRLSATVTVHNLNRAFNALLDELGLKTGADGRTRTLYSWRHFYATQDLERGVTTHALSRQLGNSTQMIDRHYSKYRPLINAELAQWTEEETLMRHQFFKTARFYAVYGSGGFSVGVLKSSENSFVWAPSLFTHQLQAKPCGCSR